MELSPAVLWLLKYGNLLIMGGMLFLIISGALMFFAAELFCKYMGWEWSDDPYNEYEKR